MASARPLHELLGDLVGDADAVHAHGDPEAYLAANGHPDLPPDLVAEAVVSYADTAPVDVAEHLAPYVTTHSAVPADEPPADDWFGLITTAPTDELDTDPDADDFSDDFSDDDAAPDAHSGPALDFGTGSVDALDAPSTAETDSDDDQATADQSDDTGQDDSPAGHQAPAWSDLDADNATLDALDADGDSEDDPDEDADELN